MDVETAITRDDIMSLDKDIDKNLAKLEKSKVSFLPNY